MRGLSSVVGGAIVLMTIAAPALTQEGRTASSAAGEVGQRQRRADSSTGVALPERVDGRIMNRVQSRIRNRIDRYYDPQANASSPFAIAGEQARAASRRTRR